MDDIKYTQNEDGSRSFNFTLTSEQLSKDQFLNNMKDGADLFKSWESQKSMIGKNNLPSQDATAEDWAKVYEKIRPADGKYGLEDEKLEKFANENGLNKYQAKNLSDMVKGLTTLPETETDPKELGKMLSGLWGDKVNEKVERINALMKNAWSEEQDKNFNGLSNSQKVAMSTLIDAILDKFGVKGADFTVGTGGSNPNPNKADREGYLKERAEIASQGRTINEFEERALRKKYNIGYIDVSKII